MAAALLGLVKGLVLDSSAVIAAERKKQSVVQLLESIFNDHGPVNLSLSPVTVAELVHGIYRAQSPEGAKRRRQYIEELVALVPVQSLTTQTAWLIGRLEGKQLRLFENRRAKFLIVITGKHLPRDTLHAVPHRGLRWQKISHSFYGTNHYEGKV